jgi:DNA-entry nuclease
MKHKTVKTLALFLTLFVFIASSGCQYTSELPDTGTSTEAETESSSVDSSDSIESETENSSEQVETAEESSSESTETTQIVDLASIPAYSGTATIEINGNVPFFSAEDQTRTDAFETYASLDSLGRCGVAYANICQEIMPTEDRGEIGSIKPTGWVQNKYPDIIKESPSYLYNRCHLIAFCLAGENANEKNLITGTRYLNIEGMLPYEEMVADYVDRTGNHVLYRVTPIFDGDNLLASGVLMEGYSVEDQGSGIQFCVYAYNVQPGISIDYATGSNWADGSSETTSDTNTTNNTSTTTNTTTNTSTSGYVINKNTKVFHSPTCSSVSRMKESNKQYSDESRDTLISKGYSPCGNCNP